MRKREDILDKFIDLGFASRLMGNDARGALINPKLHLEVLLDIRDLLVQLVEHNTKIK